MRLESGLAARENGCGAGARAKHRPPAPERGKRTPARWSVRVAGERGSGTVLVVAIIAVTMLATALIIPLFAAFAVGQSVQNAADAAALAAADTASGRVAGVPCETAGVAATLGGASVTSCEVDGLISSVSVSRSFLGFDMASRARAGPPPDG